MLAIFGVTASLRTAPRRRRRTAATTLLATLPLAGFAGLLYASPSLAHVTTQTSALGWVLAATLPLIQALTHRRSSGGEPGVDITYGGCVGLACAVLLNLAMVDEAFGPPWALAGWIMGAALVSGLMRVAPVRRPGCRSESGCARSRPRRPGSWPPSSRPRLLRNHQLATTAGAQTLSSARGRLVCPDHVSALAKRVPPAGITRSGSVSDWQVRTAAPTISALALLLRRDRFKHSHGLNLSRPMLLLTSGTPGESTTQPWLIYRAALADWISLPFIAAYC